MDANNDKLGLVGSFGEARATSPNYLPHKDEPTDRSMARPEENLAAEGHADNTYNLFDDSVIEDRKWTLLALRHLKRDKRVR